MSRKTQIRYKIDGRGWSDWIDRSLGERGQFGFPVVIMRLGRGQTFVYEIRTTDPVRADILAASAMTEPTQT